MSFPRSAGKRQSRRPHAAPETATTVRVEDGRTLTTDGPFVTVKEALGGYLFFEADDLDAAIELASRIPAARMGGAVEVRSDAERRFLEQRLAAL
ncbi:MAG TPA: YciI family protein [Gaiellaceae bacterium]|nr:YciI family protein [Gaiellaceae bacterium]